MKFRNKILLFVFYQMLTSVVFGQFPPAAGLPGSTAISNDSSIFVGWATSCEVVKGDFDISNPDLGEVWFGEEADATGKAEGNSVDVVSLGDGGSATLFFDTPIINGEGWDFAVFENALNDSFLELAFVEVSSDGINFYRFPSVSMTDSDVQIATFGAIETSKINNFAGKYRQGFGTPFDLEQLEGIGGLDLNQISWIRIVDVVGSIQDGFATFDNENHKVNDPWPTPFETGGFDLDGVGVIHASSAGIDEEQISMSVFPNPFVNSFRISLPENLQEVINIEIINQAGSIVFRNDVKSSEEIDLSGFPEGIYFLKLESAAQMIRQKILKMK
jgi:hypothetical protein